jgi:hypothetical protein
MKRLISLTPAVLEAVALLAIVASSPASSADNGGEWSGSVAFESRSFAEGPGLESQESGSQSSVVLEPEYYRELFRDGGDGRDRESFSLKLFGRLDSADPERTHFDIRELAWRKAGRSWDLVVGVDKVFWGVTESQHLVDIVNQTDLVENPDGEDKLGQPMIRWSAIRSWGIVDVFLLPGFRERTFPGEEGRLRPAVPISKHARYESGAEDRRLDLAGRWSHSVGPLDIGVSHFYGTSREPRLMPGGESAGERELVAFYEVINQSGFDLQATLSNWLLKLEAIRRSGQGPSFAAVTAGFEYTFYGVLGSRIDVGALGEALWDERGAEASTPFARDLFVGSRLGFNDPQSTEVLAGVIVDANTSATFVQIEASRRVGRWFRIEAEVRAVSGAPPQDPLAMLQADDHFQLGLSRHF